MNPLTSPGAGPGSYVFGRFRLSDDGTLLVEEGIALALAPKVLRTLLTLVERAGQVVTKDELMHAVWPGTFVEDTGLTRNISLLRQTLGDDGQSFIATVPKIGYRFVARVEHLCAADIRPRAHGSARARAQAHGDARLQWALSEPLPLPARLLPARVIVGHHRERAMLDAAFAEADQGFGRFLAVSGEPGIGKSTLAEGFVSELPERCLVGRGHCSERLAGAEPHLAILEAIDELLGSDPALAVLLRRFAPTWYIHVAARFSGGSLDAPSPSQVPGGSAERLMRELTVFLEEISRSRPVVIFIDDLHWADVSTVDLVAHLAARLARMRVMLIVAYRANEMAAAQHPFNRLRGELIARGQLTEIAVSLLTKEDVREYVQAQLAGRDVPLELPILVYRKTEGNPLFMTDLVRYLKEHGLPEGNAAEATRDVPESLKGMLHRSLELLDPKMQNLLRVAALHGNEFETAILSRLLERTEAEVEELLQTLERVHGLVTPLKEHTLPDGTFSLRCRFVHVLYQNALYASVTPSRRAEWAKGIAEALIACHGDRTDLIASELAVLYEIARDFSQAALHFLTASRMAAKRFAFREASDLARRGLDCLSSANSTKPGASSALEFDLTFALFVPLASVEGYAAANIERLSRRLLHLGEMLSDPTAMSKALAATWGVRIVRGECVAAKQGGLKLISLAQDAKDDVLLMNGHMQVLIACHHMGEFREAQTHVDAAIVLDSRVPDKDWLITILHPVVSAYSEGSRNLWAMGYLKRAREYAERAVEIGRRIRHPDSLAFAWIFHGWHHGFRRDWVQCLSSVEAGIAVASDSGSVQTLAWNRSIRGWALAHTGRIAEGIEEFSEGIALSRRIMGQVAIPQFSTMMAEMLLLRGDIDEAQDWIAQALDLSSRQFDRYFDAELHRLSAICLLKRNEPDLARGHLQKALEVARLQDAATFELRAALTLAAIDLREAKKIMDSVLARYPEPEPWPDVQDAQHHLNVQLSV